MTTALGGQRSCYAIVFQFTFCHGKCKFALAIDFACRLSVDWSVSAQRFVEVRSTVEDPSSEEAQAGPRDAQRSTEVTEIIGGGTIEALRRVPPHFFGS